MEVDVREGIIIRVVVGAMNAHDEVRQRVRKRRTLLRRAIFAAALYGLTAVLLCYGGDVHHGGDEKRSYDVELDLLRLLTIVSADVNTLALSQLTCGCK